MKLKALKSDKFKKAPENVYVAGEKVVMLSVGCFFFFFGVVFRDFLPNPNLVVPNFFFS